MSTTIDGKLLADARRAFGGLPDAVLLDKALMALLRQRRAEINAAYTGYDEHPLAQADRWGDLASFREAAAGHHR
jgi:hypothetical protein